MDDGYQAARAALLTTLAAVVPGDAVSREHLDVARAWAASGAPLWRTAKPATPPMHLVAYVLVRDPVTGRFLLVEHRGAGLLLPAGGHVEPGEDPWSTAVRETREEFRHDVDSGWQAPVFVTVTETRGPGRHTDVSLWYLVDVAETRISWWDPAEFTGVRWLTGDEILAAPAETLDPHLHRFVTSALPLSRTGGRLG